jgi:hypothetical protein
MKTNTFTVYICIDDAALVRVHADVTVEYKADKYNLDIEDYNVLKIENLSLTVTANGSVEQEFKLSQEMVDAYIANKTDEFVDAFFEELDFFDVVKRIRNR